MSELGDLLELMHTADERFRTLRGVLRRWTHHGRQHAAFRRQAGDEGHSSSAWAILSGEPGPGPGLRPDVEEARIRIWLEAPDRLRDERDGGVLVRVGDTWWSYQPGMGAMTNAGDPHHQHGPSFDVGLIVPGSLLPGLRLRLAGERHLAGRRGLVVDAAPRVTLLGDLVLHGVSLPAEQTFVVDAERGVLLRRELRLDGEPYLVEEFEELAFDEPIPESTFVFVLPDGEDVADAAQLVPRPEQRPLRQIAAEAPFAVLAAPTVQPGWQLLATATAEHGRGLWPATVQLRYSSADGSERVSVHQQAATGRLPTDDEPGWQRVRRGGHDLYVMHTADAFDDGGAELPFIVLFERDGTRVTAQSPSLELDRLLDFCAFLAPVR